MTERSECIVYVGVRLMSRLCQTTSEQKAMLAIRKPKVVVSL